MRKPHPKHNQTATVGADLAMQRAIRRALLKSLDEAEDQAEDLDVPYDIDMEWALAEIEEQGSKCYVTEIPFFEDGNKRYNSHFAPWIIRLYQKGGYTKDNCRVVLHGMEDILCKWGWGTALSIFRAWRKHDTGRIIL